MEFIWDIVRDKIDRSAGRITFAEFMSTVLYHPRLGYYCRPEMTVGERGDFYTSPMVHSAFGRSVARQLYEIWVLMEKPMPFTIVEIGAGMGAMAQQVLNYLGNLDEECIIDYHIVETSSSLRKRQAEILSPFTVSWHSHLGQLPLGITGVVVSNEFFDALPIHRLIVQNGRLHERYVMLASEESLGYSIGPLSSPALESYVGYDIASGWQDGDLFDICPSAAAMLRQVADTLHKGFVLTIDYGDRQPDVFTKNNKTGGVRCYLRQQLRFDPLEHLGEQDITADVDFSSLEHSGLQGGLQTVGMINQTGFLAGTGYLEELAIVQKRGWTDLEADREWQRMLTLFLPQGLGDACKVLIQSKNMQPVSLRGLKSNW